MTLLRAENEDCQTWSSEHNTAMLLWSEKQWREQVEAAGFDVLHQWRSGKKQVHEPGTMTVVARNSGGAGAGVTDRRTEP